MTTRHIQTVIADILAIVPVRHDRLIDDIKRIRTSAAYTPPESMEAHWQRLEATLKDGLGSEWSGWQCRVAKIMEETDR